MHGETLKFVIPLLHLKV